jgi:hypothetical protein
MPYASTRTKGGTRVGGGPIFWLFAGMFIIAGYVAKYLFIFLFKLAELIVDQTAQALERRRQAKLLKANANAPIIKAPDLRDAEPEDARPAR